MNSLFLDLASHAGLLACVTADAVIASEPVDHRIGDHELLPLLEVVLGRAKWSYQDLTHIACVTGPGGFMSLRVAVSLANTLVHQLKIPGTGVHLSELYAERAGIRQLAIGNWQKANSHPSTSLRAGKPQATSLFWLHSTKKHELFVRGFGEYAKLWPEATHVMLEEAEKEIPKSAQWVGELIPEHEKILQEKGAVPATVKTVVEVLPEFLAKQSFAPTLLTPWYGREG